MKKARKVIIFLGLLATFLTSCKSPLMKDPRLYNKKPDKNKGTVIPTEEPEIEAPSGFSTFDLLDQWYNNPNSNGDETNPDAVGFSNEEFNTIAIKGWFNKQNVPTYTLTKQDVWGSCTNEKTNEYQHKNAPDTEGQGFSINGVTYFQYRGKNPCYAGDGAFNTQLQKTAYGNPLLERFYFYRFTGKGGGIQWLDNFLIAVDTYSKLVFAFAEPVAFSSMGAPTAWAPTDKDKYNGAVYPFYMYDPVGYVLKNDDGTYTTELYDWFKQNLAKGNYRCGMNFDTVAQKKTTGAGKSPFLSAIDQSDVPFLDKVSDVTFSFRQLNEKFKDTLKPTFETDGQGFGDILYSIKFSKDGRSVTFTETPWEGKEKVFCTGTTQATSDDKSSAVYVLNGDFGDQKFTDVKILFETDSEVTSIKLYEYIEPVETPAPEPEGTETPGTNTDSENQEDAQSQVRLAAETDSTENKEPSSTEGENTETPKEEPEPQKPEVKGQFKGTYYKNFGDKGPTFERKVKGHTYGYREADGYDGSDGQGYGFNLHTISFVEENGIISKIDDWRGYKNEPVTETFEESKTDFLKASVGDKTLTISNDGKSITIGENIYYRDFPTVDKGPSFANRVKNDPYYKGSKYNYQFQNGYKNLKVNDELYSFVEFRNERNAAVYKKYMLGTTYYYGVELTPNPDTKAKDGLIRMTDGAWWVSTIIWDTKRFDAIRDDAFFGKTFLDIVKGKTYTHRAREGYEIKDGQGFGLTLHIFKFNLEGNLTYKTSLWNESSEQEKGQYTINIDNTNPVNGILTVDNKDYKLKVNNSGNMLTVDNEVFTTDKDLGPSFLNRVKGKKFYNTNGKLIYDFSDDGKTLKVDGNTYSYDLEVKNQDGRKRGGYSEYSKRGGLGWIYKWYFIGVEINEPTKIQKTNEIQASHSVDWGSLGNEATLKN